MNGYQIISVPSVQEYWSAGTGIDRHWENSCKFPVIGEFMKIYTIQWHFRSECRGGWPMSSSLYITMCHNRGGGGKHPFHCYDCEQSKHSQPLGDTRTFAHLHASRISPCMGNIFENSLRDYQQSKINFSIASTNTLNTAYDNLL